MRFVINARFLAKPVTGVGRVGRELLRALLEELAERPAAQRPAIEIAAPPNVRVAGSAAAGVPVIDGPSNLLGEQALLPFSRPGATILSFANSTPLLARRSIIWIHDAHVFEAPESYGRFYRLWHQNLLRLSVLRRFTVVTVSDYSRGALIKHGADPERTHVIHNGGDHILREQTDDSIVAAHGLDERPFVLLVGSRAKHKNIPFAVEALSRRLPAEVAIAVAGLHQLGPYGEQSALSPDKRVKRLPMLTDAELRALYERARCVVIPSVLEGFSLPAAEAMFCGAPLVLANRTALPEVGGQAGLYFEPDDADALAARVMATFEPATRARLLAAGEVQRERFRWRNGARLLLERHLRV